MIQAWLAKIGWKALVYLVIACVIGGMAWQISHLNERVEDGQKLVKAADQRVADTEAKLTAAEARITTFVANEEVKSKLLAEHERKEKALVKTVDEFRRRERNEKSTEIPASCVDVCTAAYGPLIRAFDWVRRQQADGDGDDFGGVDPARPVVSGRPDGSRGQ